MIREPLGLSLTLCWREFVSCWHMPRDSPLGDRLSRFGWQGVILDVFDGF